MLAVLASVRALLLWAQSHGIELEQRFARRRFLTDVEIESLRSYSQSRYVPSSPHVLPVSPVTRSGEAARALLRRPNDDDRVSSGIHLTRMTYMAAYMEWLARRMVERDAGHRDGVARTQIEGMVKSLRLHRPKKVSRSILSARRGLSEPAQQKLFQLLRPSSPDKPFQPLVEKRNLLIVTLLHQLGIRAGALLVLKVSDFDFEKNEVVIIRRYGDARDPRKNQAVVKTNDSRIPLGNELSAAVSEYVLIIRRQSSASKYHAYLLVTHQPGPYEGKPLTIKWLTKVLSVIQQVDPVLLSDLTAHVKRHTANDRFSELMDAKEVSEAQEEKMRSYWMG